ncbi:MAG: hypothetical protein WBB82_09845 [Limnothrix sp.]
MSNTSNNQIGKLLTEAGLISTGQLQTALYDQQIYSDMRVGEILALRGWLSQRTADFFGDFLQSDQVTKEKLLLGEYFLNANLVSQKQINEILAEQQLNHVRFGSIAVLKGYISQETLDFFLKRVNPTPIGGKDYLQGNLELARKTLNQRNKETKIQHITLSDNETLVLKSLDPVPLGSTPPGLENETRTKGEIKWI